MIPSKTIEELILKHSTLEKDLSSGEVDKKLFAEKSKEYSDLNEIIDQVNRYSSYDKDKIELEKINLSLIGISQKLKNLLFLELKKY